MIVVSLGGNMMTSRVAPNMVLPGHDAIAEGLTKHLRWLLICGPGRADTERKLQELTCDCGHRITAVTGTFRKAAYEHLRQSAGRHNTADKATLLYRLLGQALVTVARDRETSQQYGAPLLGAAEILPQLPPDLAEMPSEGQMLARSVSALGEMVPNWTVEDALTLSPKYRDVVQVFLSDAGVYNLSSRGSFAIGLTVQRYFYLALL